MNARTRHAIVLGAVALLLIGVLLLYMQPAFIVTLANQLWNCF